MGQCPAHEDRNPSLSITEKNGKVLIHCFAGCGPADVIAALRVRGLWPEDEQNSWTPADRARWARERRELERQLPAARHWRGVALELVEERLTILKAAAFDPTADAELKEAVLNDAIFSTETALRRLARLDSGDLVAEYQSWHRQYPELTAAMVRRGEIRERAACRGLLRYLQELEAQPAT
jgi:hypothetical protein